MEARSSADVSSGQSADDSKQEQVIEELFELDYSIYDHVTRDIKQELAESDIDESRAVLAVKEEYEDNPTQLSVRIIERPEELYEVLPIEEVIENLFQAFYEPGMTEEAVSEAQTRLENVSAEAEYVAELLEEFADNPALEKEYTLEGVSESAGTQTLQNIYMEALEEIDAEIYFI